MTEVLEANVVEEEPVRHLPATREHSALAVADELTVDEIVAQVELISQIQARVMREDEHFGVIPGTRKPTLLKPGAEKLVMTFRLRPHFDDEQRWDGDHLSVTSRCTLSHIRTGDVWVSGATGFCSTREERYAFRKAQRECPMCGQAAIFKSKHPPRDDPSAESGWFCWKKEGGCGQNFAANAPAIVQQPEGKVPNERLADTWNTVVKMAQKRALVAAVLMGTAASDIFTQDVEDSVSPAAGSDTTTSDPAAPSRAPDAPAEATVKAVKALRANLLTLDYTDAAVDRYFAENRVDGVLTAEWVAEKIEKTSESIAKRGEEAKAGATAA